LKLQSFDVLSWVFQMNIVFQHTILKLREIIPSRYDRIRGLEAVARLNDQLIRQIELLFIFLLSEYF
jgi:hypothetical protein